MNDINLLKNEFNELRREFICAPKAGTFGKEFKGGKVNPIISEKRKQPKKQRRLK